MPCEVQFYGEGLREFVCSLNKSYQSLLPLPVYVESENLEISVQLAFCYNCSLFEKIFSYVNNIKTTQGGTHVSGFYRGLNQALKAYAKKEEILEKGAIIATRDLKKGLTAVISLKMPNPRFDEITKTRLSNKEVTKLISKILAKAFKEYLKEHHEESGLLSGKCCKFQFKTLY